MRYCTLPARLHTKRGTSVFRMGPRVNEQAVNLAFVQSVSMDIQENMQYADLGHLIPENQLPAFVDMTRSEAVYTAPAEALDQLSSTSNTVLTDRMFVAANALYTVAPWDGASELIAKYKLFSTWVHIESEPVRDEGAGITESLSPNYSNATLTTGTWYPYQGNQISLVNGDGTAFTGRKAIYIRKYTGSSILRNVWHVLAYIDDASDPVYLRYNKGELRGGGLTSITGYEQDYDERVTLLPVLMESVTPGSRTWKAAGVPAIDGRETGDHVRVFFEDAAKIQVRVPETADNHGAWFIDIKKGTFGQETTNGDVDGLALSPEARIMLGMARQKFTTVYSSTPASSATVRFTYSTEEYSQNRQGRDVSSTLVYARGVSGSITDAHVTLPYPVYPGMPIVIFVTENFADDEQVWVITNITNDRGETSWSSILQELRRSGVSWYDGIRNIPQVEDRRILRVIGIDGTKVHFDNTVYRGARYQKYFTTLADVRAFFYYRNSWVSFTGFKQGASFYPCDLNPSLGHAFSGRVWKDMRYDEARGVWKSGISITSATDVILYDTTNQTLTPGQSSPAVISQLDWLFNPKTDLAAGEFEVTNYRGDRRISLVCTAKAIPGYNLFTTPITLKMLPCKITIIDTTDGYKEVSVPLYAWSEKIIFETGTLPIPPWDTIILSRIQLVPNSIYGQNTLFDTRSRGGGLRDAVEPVGGERHFWDIGFMDGQPYTGNQAIVIEVPTSVKQQYIEKGLDEKQIEELFRLKLKKYVAKGSLVMIQYV